MEKEKKLFNFSDIENPSLEIVEKALSVKLPDSYKTFYSKYNFENTFNFDLELFFIAIHIKNEYYPNGFFLNFMGLLTIEELIDRQKDNQLIMTFGNDIGSGIFVFAEEGSVLYSINVESDNENYGKIYAMDFNFYNPQVHNDTFFTFEVADSFDQFVDMFELFPYNS